MYCSTSTSLLSENIVRNCQEEHFANTQTRFSLTNNVNKSFNKGLEQSVSAWHTLRKAQLPPRIIFCLTSIKKDGVAAFLVFTADYSCQPSQMQLTQSFSDVHIPH